MASDNDKRLNLTNNSGQDVVLALAVSDEETTGTNALIVANGQLEVLKTTAGGTIIKKGTTDAVLLDRSYKPEGEGSGPVQDYDVQVCDSAWLYPLANLQVAQQDGGYPSQTITDANWQGMAQAAAFYQTIAVYPGAQLTTDYAAAISAAKNQALAKANDSADSAQAVANAIDGTMTAFFKNTQEYKQVTLADVTAVHQYHINFPCAWAQYSDNATYYLYGSNGGAALFVGILSLQKSGIIDVTKPAGGYACSFIPAATPADIASTDVDETKAVTLTYADGLFVDDATSATPAIGLRGSYLLSSFFTSAAEDTDVVTIVTGTVNGMLCIGLDAPQRTASQRERHLSVNGFSGIVVKYWGVLTHPKDLSGWIVSIMSAVGAVLAIPATVSAVYIIYKIARAIGRAKEPLPNKTVADHMAEPMIDEATKRIKWVGSDKPVVPEWGLEQLAQASDALYYGRLGAELAFAFQLQDNAIGRLLAYKSSMDETAIKTLDDAQQSIETWLDDIDTAKELKPENLPDVLKRGYDACGKLQSDFEGVYTSVLQQMGKAERENIDGFMSECSRLFTNMDEAAKSKTEETTDLNPDVKEEVLPDFVIQ